MIVGNNSAGGAREVGIWDNLNVAGNTSINGITISNEIYNNGWYRSNGATGWYSETYGGGIYMEDSTWVRTYGAKSLWTNSTLGSNAGLTV